VAGLERAEQRMEKGLAKRLAYRLLGTGALAPAAARRLARGWAARAIADHRRWQAELEAGLARLELGGKLERSEHHLSHAANAYLASGFDRALVVTLDGYGSGLAGSVSVGQDGALERLADVPFPHSLGSFYEAVTSSLGFHPDRHAGKIVGLAAYGDPAVLREVLLAGITQGDGAFRLHDNLNLYLSRHLASRFAMIDVAAAWQHVLEVVACRFVEHWVGRTGCDRLVLSGGVAANVKLNQRLHALPGVARDLRLPEHGRRRLRDGAGAAAVAARAAHRRRRCATSTLGRPSTSGSARRRCARRACPSSGPPTRARWLRGRAPHPRGPGRRTLRRPHGVRPARARQPLDPLPRARAGVNQWLNQRLGRTEFMPFAPVTLAEARGRCYAGLAGAEHAAEFMTMTFDCTPWMRSQCPAAVHVDGTARPQLLRREVNPAYADILREYERLSGVPCLINTSFNMHEEPIVCSPQDAIRAFLLGHLDALVLGPFLAGNPRAPAPQAGAAGGRSTRGATARGAARDQARR
jgi:carbamoyltransferase